MTEQSILDLTPRLLRNYKRTRRLADHGSDLRDIGVEARRGPRHPHRIFLILEPSGYFVADCTEEQARLMGFDVP